MKRGDLVKSIKHKSIGVVVEIFDDLNPDNAWVRVLFTTPKERYQWVKSDSLKVLNKKKGGASLLSSDVARSGSL